MKGLAALIRLHSWRLDEKRRELADLQRLEDQLLADAQRLEDEMAAEQEFAARNTDTAAFTYGGFAIGVIERRKRIAASIAVIRRRIDDKRAEVAEAFQELKRYEITQAERQKRARAEAERRAQAELDEISLEQHIRRTES